MNTAIQLYSLRDIFERDFNAAIEPLAQMGYEGVETAGMYNHTPEQVRDCAERNNIKIWSAHINRADCERDFEAMVNQLKTLGTDDAILAWDQFHTLEERDAVIRAFNDLNRRFAEKGIRLHYHNHAHEFKATEGGFLMMDEIVEKTDLLLEMDAFWVYHSGNDPVEFINKHHQRMKYIHLKDGVRNDEGIEGKRIEFPLGKGDVPIKAVIDAAQKHSLKIVVESTTQIPDGIAEARECMEYLKKTL